MNMARTTKFLAAALLAGSMFGWASAAQADPVSIGVSLNGSSPLPAIAYGCAAPVAGTCTSGATPGYASVTGYQIGDFSINASGYGTGAFGGNPEPAFNSNSVSVTFTGTGQTPQTITIYVTEQYLSFQDASSFNALSSFSYTHETTPMTNVSEATYIDNNNFDFGTGTLIASTPISNTGPAPINFITPTGTLGTPYAITEAYTMTASASGQHANLSISFDAVPEPSALSIFGTALLALGGIFWFRRRKMQA